MTDKEVGELWAIGRKLHHSERNINYEALIRKLVEERAKTFQVPEMYVQIPRKRLIVLALRDFGIPPEDWK